MQGRILALILPLIFVSLPASAATSCLSIDQARDHVGETKCITGTVHRVKVGAKGVQFLDFCEESPACPFTVVVFSSRLKDIGDIRRLAGRNIEIHGAVKLYDGHPEMVLNRISQITNGAAMVPVLPKDYDVEKQGHFSPGRMRPTKKPAKTKATPNTTATYGNDVEGLEPPE